MSRPDWTVQQEKARLLPTRCRDGRVFCVGNTQGFDHATGRSPPLEQWRQARAEARRIRAFNADDADFAPLQVRNEIRKFGLGQVEACEIEDDRFPNKKALGAPHLTVELGHPVAKRQLWRKHERHK